MEDKIPLRYCLYARKSSEADEKQAMSIDSQIAEMHKLAEKEKLDIVETIRESKSATIHLIIPKGCIFESFFSLSRRFERCLAKAQ